MPSAIFPPAEKKSSFECDQLLGKSRMKYSGFFFFLFHRTKRLLLLWNASDVNHTSHQPTSSPLYSKQNLKKGKKIAKPPLSMCIWGQSPCQACLYSVSQMTPTHNIIPEPIYFLGHQGKEFSQTLVNLTYSLNYYQLKKILTFVWKNKQGKSLKKTWKKKKERQESICGYDYPTLKIILTLQQLKPLKGGK